MIAPLWLLIGFLFATDHIVTATDGITKVTDHFALKMLLENGVGGPPSIFYSQAKISKSVSDSSEGVQASALNCTFVLEVNKQSG